MAEPVLATVAGFRLICSVRESLPPCLPLNAAAAEPITITSPNNNVLTPVECPCILRSNHTTPQSAMEMVDVTLHFNASTASTSSFAVHSAANYFILQRCIPRLGKHFHFNVRSPC